MQITKFAKQSKEVGGGQDKQIAEIIAFIRNQEYSHMPEHILCFILG